MTMCVRVPRWLLWASALAACDAGGDTQRGPEDARTGLEDARTGAEEARTGLEDARTGLDTRTWLDARPDLSSGPPVDAATPDAAGAPRVDAAPDVSPAPVDAAEADAQAPDAEPPDAQVPPDAGFIGVPCAVAGAAGLCLEVSACPDDHHPTPGHCPGPAEVQCCTEGPPPEPGLCDAEVLRRPAALPPEAPGDPGCPPGMAAVDTFCVDRYEAALVERVAGGERPWSPYHNPEDRVMRAVSVAGAVPQGYINGVQAAAACTEAGKRLCDDAEWLRACQGPDATTYPYGDARQPGLCNDARAQHPAVELFPDDPTPFDRIQDACINQLPASLEATGANPGCVSADGVFDLMGNLHEWTSDPAGTFRGGFYVDTVVNGPGCLYRTTAHDTGHWDYSTGFRCCADGP